MPQKTVLVAIIGSTLIALLLTGSLRNAASSPLKNAPEEAAIEQLTDHAKALVAAGHYLEARNAFRAIASRAEKARLTRRTAMSWSNAGGCSLLAMQYGAAKADFAKAQTSAIANHEYFPLASAMNSLASLYIQTGQPENAVRVAREALDGPAGNADQKMRSRLHYQLGLAYLELDRLSEAKPFYTEAISGFLDQKELDSAARAWSAIGSQFLRVGHLEEAETALSEGLRLVRIHRLNASVGILAGLARLRSAQGDQRSAAILFDEALAAPPGITPRYMIYAYRGKFRLDSHDLRGALADFREARKLVSEMRVEMVPADQDRISLERGLSELFGIYEGFIDAGNRLALATNNKSLLRETFDAAEQNRLWSLRALIPSPNDWRTRLPENYWELLARYQSLERAALAKPTPALTKQTGALRLSLQQIEAAAAGDTMAHETGSPLAHLEHSLDNDSVVLSFHLSDTSSWLWAADRTHLQTFPLPPLPEIRRDVQTLKTELRSGKPSNGAGAKLYKQLFGAVPPAFLRHKRWLLELDGPLYELPFAALVVESDPANPVYLIERAELQSLPNALLAEKDSIPANGAFLAVGDPVYNGADSRYQGKHGASSLLLARLPNTTDEVQACARAWGGVSQFLIGSEASVSKLHAAIDSHPAIIHFATHVVTEPGDFRSGLIALSLNPSGEMDLLGPKEIVARPVTSKLVVMDGCHSAQGASLPSAGLMGLTRAWIGAGAMSVVATQWDVPDDAAQLLMSDFYGELHRAPEKGVAGALRHAQLAALNRPEGRQTPSVWSGYFLLSRSL